MYGKKKMKAMGWQKLFIEVDGAKLGMFVGAKDESKPVLLILGGGPGIPEFFLEQKYPTGLLKEFVVCYVEYRGAGISYNGGLPLDTLTTEQYRKDALAITKYLCERYGWDKLYLMGHSFGSYIGLQMAQRYPEYYYAYIAMSQNCRQQDSEYMAYDYMKEQYEKAGNKKMLKKFIDCPIRESDEAYQRYFSSSLRDTAMHDLGVGTTRSMKSVITGIFFPSLVCRAYTLRERIQIWKGKRHLQSAKVVEDGIHFDAFTEVPKLTIPIYFFAGQYDYTCCYALQKQYFSSVEAPKKEFYTFERSAHSPIFEEPGKALSLLHSIKVEAVE